MKEKGDGNRTKFKKGFLWGRNVLIYNLCLFRLIDMFHSNKQEAKDYYRYNNVRIKLCGST